MAEAFDGLTHFAAGLTSSVRLWGWPGWRAVHTTAPQNNQRRGLEFIII